MTETTDRPLVTFALFAYNQEQYIREAVEGAFSQTYEPLEIILSDDCSTDRTYEIMQEMAAAYEGPHEVRVRRNAGNVGLAQHINNVHCVSHGQYMTWSAGDDIALPHRTSRFLEALKKNSSNLVHSSLFEIDVASRTIGERIHAGNIRYPTAASVILLNQGVVTQSFCFNRSAFEIFGGFEPDLAHEAIPFGFRAAMVGGISYIEEPLTKYRVGSGVSTQRNGTLTDAKYNEPIKVSHWRLTALQQIMRDISVLGKTAPERLHNLVASELKKWQAIQSINRGTYLDLNFEEFFRIFSDKDMARAFLRRNSPELLYKGILSLREKRCAG